VVSLTSREHLKFGHFNGQSAQFTIGVAIYYVVECISEYL